MRCARSVLTVSGAHWPGPSERAPVRYRRPRRAQRTAQAGIIRLGVDRCRKRPRLPIAASACRVSCSAFRRMAGNSLDVTACKKECCDRKNDSHAHVRKCGVRLSRGLGLRVRISQRLTRIANHFDRKTPLIEAGRREFATIRIWQTRHSTTRGVVGCRWLSVYRVCQLSWQQRCPSLSAIVPPGHHSSNGDGAVAGDRHLPG
jgi:hypothetical protein